MKNSANFCLWISSLYFLIAFPCKAQEPISSNQPIQEITSLSAVIQKLITLKSNEVLRVKMPQLSSNNTSQIAVFLGATDITSQIEINGTELVYKSNLVPLPIGEQILTIYLIRSTDVWDKLTSFPIRIEPDLAQSLNPIKLLVGEPPPSSTTEVVANSIDPKSVLVIAQGSTPPVDLPAIPSGTPPVPEITQLSTPPESIPPVPAGTQPPTPPAIPVEIIPSTSTNLEPNSTFIPRFNGNIRSQVLDIRNPAVTSQRPTFINIDFTGGLSTENQIGKTKVKSKFTVVGTSFQPESLRFNELRERASQIDLSEYAIESNDGNNQFAVGHLCFGNHPFLLNNLCTRGISAKVKLNKFTDLSLARISSTGIVGLDNIFGLGRGDNILNGGNLGFQVAQNQGGGVRLETTWMSGVRAPINSVNVGGVVEAEQSEGVGIRVTGSDDTSRLKADAGFANSTFFNPAANDPQLTGGGNVTQLQPVNKNAWYAEASYDLLRDIKLDSSRTLSAAMNVRTERIDPQFGTLGASLQADRLQTQYALNMNVAGASIQFQQNFSEDNLASLPNLLRTNNQNTNFNLGIPLQTVLQTQNSLLPNLTYGLQQTHQLSSISAAANGGFNNPSQIPDQLNTTHQFGLDWTFGDLTFNYKYANTFQDNRQVGRENADTRNISHQLSTNWQINPQLRFNLGYNFLSNDNIEQQITNFTSSPTLGLSWELNPGLLFAFNYNLSNNSDSRDRAANRAESLELLLTYNFKLNSFGRDLPGTSFIRYNKQSASSRDTFNNINSDAANDAITAGFSLSF